MASLNVRDWGSGLSGERLPLVDGLGVGEAKLLEEALLSVVAMLSATEMRLTTGDAMVLLHT